MTQVFSIRQIYLKDASFQAPTGVRVFTQEWEPEIKVDVNVTSEALGGPNYEVVLTITVIARNSGETAYMVEILQAGIFHLAGYSDAQLDRVLNTGCPTMLYPYAREAIDGLVARGRLPALILEPVNFDANYTVR